MGGTPIKVAKEALKLFIKSIPEGSKFNVVSFGSNFESIWNESQDYSNENVDEALSKVSAFDADLGGTEIYQPLDFVFNSRKSSDLQTHVYLITDGCVSSVDQVTGLIALNSHDHCVHAIGIGSGVSTSLIIEASNAGKGSYYFVDDYATGLNEIIINALCASMEPAYQILDKKLNLNCSPILQSPSFDSGGFMRHGSTFTYYAILSGDV